MAVIASAVGESAGTVWVSGALILMELAGGTFKVTEGVGAIPPKRVDLQIDPARYRGSKSESAREKSDAQKLRFRGVFDSRTNDPLFS